MTLEWFAERERKRRDKWRSARSVAAARTRGGLLSDIWLSFAVLARDSRSAVGVALLVIGTSLLLTSTPQGLDIAYSVSSTWSGLNRPTVVGVGLTLLLTLWFSTQIWFWIRSVFDDVYEDTADNTPRYLKPRWLYEWFPRVVGSLPFFTLAYCFAICGNPLINSLSSSAMFAFAGALFLVALWSRGGLIKPGSEPALAVATLFRWVTYGCCLLTMALFLIIPIGISQLLAPAGTVFLGVSLIIPVLATLLHASKTARLPIFGLVVVAVVAMTGAVDNHAVGRRAFGGGFSPVFKPSDRPDLKEDFCAWVKAQNRGQTCKPGGETGDPLPIVFVSAEGGASRAGYWAADVLTELDRRTQGAFARELYVISSVSGGSVGAAAYLTQLRIRRAERCSNLSCDDIVALRKTVASDFLSPALGGLLFPDLAQRFIPVPILPDRAEMLERALEAGWRDAHQPLGRQKRNPNQAYAYDAWSYPFLDIWATASQRLPALIINGAREEDGRRILTSSLRFGPEVTPDGVDFYQLSDQDIRVSTAIVNGARFPIVSPGGTLMRQGRADGHVLDGGYFDGNGMVTLHDIAAAIMGIARSNGIALKPIFVEINNDSDDPDNSPELYRASPPLKRCGLPDGERPAYCKAWRGARRWRHAISPAAPRAISAPTYLVR